MKKLLKEINNYFKELGESVVKAFENIDIPNKTFEEENTMANSNLNLSAPWITYQHNIEALFGPDPEIAIKFEEEDDGNYTIKLYVRNHDKAEALSKILPGEKVFGNIKVTNLVIPENAVEEESVKDLFKVAFKNNPVVESVVGVIDPLTKFERSFVLFEKRVVQYYNDDMTDPYGNRSILYKDVAEEVFDGHDGIFFSTSPDEFSCRCDYPNDI